MANANNSIITGRFKGSLGKQLVFREWQGKTIVAKAPRPRTGNPTTAQAERQEKFLLASRYAKSVISHPDPSLAEGYGKALRPRQNIYSRALEDFMSPPVVKSVDTRHYSGLVGDKIIVRAIDDFRVVAVTLELYAADGSLLESGNAVLQLNGLDWTYTASVANSVLTGSTIKAIATDVPGNEGMLETIL